MQDINHPPIVYKEFYNKGRSMPEPILGTTKLNYVKCPTCSSLDVYVSAHPDDPDEMFYGETVRCKHCGHITDWYEAHKQWRDHLGGKIRRVIREQSNGDFNRCLDIGNIGRRTS